MDSDRVRKDQRPPPAAAPGNAPIDGRRLTAGQRGPDARVRPPRFRSARLGLLVALSLFAGTGRADWSGISLELADVDSDWKFDGETREAQINKLSFRAEENTASGLRVGFALGLLDMRVVGATPAATKNFDGEFLGVYLHQPFRITDAVSFYGLLSYTYHNGRENGSPDEPADFDWNEAAMQFGISARLGLLRFTPFVSYTRIDGDIRDDTGTRVFEQKEAQSQGLRIDYFVDPTAYIRLEFVDGAYTGGYLNFVREY